MPRMTKELAVAANPGYILYSSVDVNADQSPLRARVNGRCKTWKTRPTDFQLPMKHGLKHCFYVTHRNCDVWFTTEEDAKAASAAQQAAAEEVREKFRKGTAYPEFCRDPGACRGKGYCPKDPTCAD